MAGGRALVVGWLAAWLVAGHWLCGRRSVWLPEWQAAFSAGCKSAYHIDILPYQLAISLVAPQTWSQTLELRLIPSMRMYDSRSALHSEFMTGRHADLLKTYLIAAAKPEPRECDRTLPEHDCPHVCRMAYIQSSRYADSCLPALCESRAPAAPLPANCIQFQLSAHSMSETVNRGNSCMLTAKADSMSASVSSVIRSDHINTPHGNHLRGNMSLSKMPDGRPTGAFSLLNSHTGVLPQVFVPAALFPCPHDPATLRCCTGGRDAAPDCMAAWTVGRLQSGHGCRDAVTDRMAVWGEGLLQSGHGCRNAAPDRMAVCTVGRLQYDPGSIAAAYGCMTGLSVGQLLCPPASLLLAAQVFCWSHGSMTALSVGLLLCTPA